MKNGEEDGLERVLVRGAGVGKEGGEEGGRGGRRQRGGVVLPYPLVASLVSGGCRGEERCPSLLLFLFPSFVSLLLFQHQFYIRRAKPSFPPFLPPSLLLEDLTVQHAEQAGMTQVGEALDKAGRRGGGRARVRDR